MTPAPRKPAPFEVGAVKVAARKPPTARCPGWYWRAVVYEDGQERTVWVGRASREEAIATVSALVAEGRHHASAQDGIAPTDITTVELLLRAWFGAIEDRGDLRPATVSTYKGHARRLVQSMGTVRLDRVSKLTPEQHRDRALRAGTSTATVHTDLRVLGLAWRWGRSVGVVSDRELVMPKVKVEPTRAKRTPTIEEVERVIAAAPSYVKGVLEVMSGTGCRVGEAAGLRVGDVDLERSTITMHGKTGARTIPVDSWVVSCLRPWVAGRRAEDRMWTVTADTARRRVMASLPQLCALVKVPVFRSHGLRRSAADRMLRSGVDVATAAAILGHSPEVLLRYYRQVTLDDMTAAVARSGLGARTGKVIDFRGNNSK